MSGCHNIQMERDNPIDHPAHYNQGHIHCECGRAIECIDISSHFDFALGNVIKYIWRHQQKRGIEDLKKAQWYLNYTIGHYEEKCINKTS